MNNEPMKHIRYIVHVFIACFALLLCPLHAENDLTEAEMDSLAMKFNSWEKGNENDSRRHQQIIDSYAMRAFESYTQSHEYAIAQDNNLQTYIEKMLIIVKENIFSAMPSYIVRYAHDIHNTYGCAVDIVSVNGENASQIKSLIQNYSTNLNGAVLVGNIAYTYFYHPDSIVRGDTIWKHETFPCDYYYMDLNGNWGLQTGQVNTYDTHTMDVKPEIFVGRINTSTMGRNEIQELKWYFDRNHKYWTGHKALQKQRGLTFTGPDWASSSLEFIEGVSPLYGSNYYDQVYGINNFTKANYCTYLQDNDYEFVQLACHSNVQHHNFKTTSDSILRYSKIDSLQTKQIGYNLFCCHACDWTDCSTLPCLGESYLYGMNNNSSTLALVGSTKTGGMLGLRKFYNPLGSGKCIGQAFKEWWINRWGTNHNHYTHHWAYGMVILGDPLVDFNFTNECENILYLNNGEEATNNMYYAQSKIVVQNYSLTQGQSVTLSAPSVQITGPFLCNVGSSFIATPQDSCKCNTRTLVTNSKHIRVHKSNTNTKTDAHLLLSIYPNPVSDILTIETNEQLTLISIYNQSGQCVLQTKESHINVSHLSVGIYILRLITKNNQCVQRKFIKQ